MKLSDIISNSKETDSQDEVYFEWYLEELKKEGYIKSYHRSNLIELTKPIPHWYVVKMKTKEKVNMRNVSSEISYTPDYVILWETKAEGVFYQRYDCNTKIGARVDKPQTFPMFLAKEIDEEIVTIVDVKPDMKQAFNKFSTSYTFAGKQALMYLVHNLIVCKVKIVPQMKSTFTPSRYLLTNKNGSERKFKWKATTLRQYVDKILDNQN